MRFGHGRLTGRHGTMEDMSKAEFKVSYDGPALLDGSMDVRDLAPALLAVGQFFDAANKELNGKRATVRTQVVASKEGSFEVSLLLDQNLIQGAIDFLSGDEVTAALQLRDILVGTSGVGIIWLIKKLKGKNPSKVERLEPGQVRVTIEGETFDVPEVIERLSRVDAIRRTLEKMIADPLKREGVNIFAVSDAKRKETVEDSDGDYFRRQASPDDPIVDETRRQAFRIDSLSFKDGRKWRLSDGSEAISATMNDQDFVNRVSKSAIAFSKSDVLMCDVRTQQFYRDGNLKTEHSVERVIRHEPYAKQLPLSLGGESDDTS